MKAIVFDRFGPPAEVLSVRDVPTPVPGRGEVLVRMLASPLNPSDLLYVAGEYGSRRPQLPATPGFEGVGVVEASGGGGLGWLRRGQRVAVFNDGIGNWAEYTVVKALQVIPVPAQLPDEQAATMLVNPATALAMTRAVLRVPSGEWLLQSAAGGELGKMVVRLGHRYGFRTIGVVRRREQVDELTRLGANAVVVEGDGAIDEQVRALTGGLGVPYAIDAVGGTTGSAVISSLADRGRCLVYGGLAAQPVVVDPARLVFGAITVEGFYLPHWLRRRPLPAQLRHLSRVARLIQAGTLHTHVAARYPLSQITDAVQHATSKGKGGKVLLQIG
ncbi:MAG: zinc-dependent alcohol dehydrogenase family protein [Micropruina sp.]